MRSILSIFFGFAVGFSLRSTTAALPQLNEDLIVETKYGKIQGTTTKAVNHRLIYSFKSIPYAKPPQRFQPPQSLKVDEDGWGDTIRDGTQNPPSCAQHITNLSPASEDCLFLNIFSPIKPGSSNQKLPVMFFIHGGGYLLGDSLIYGPNRLLSNDVILVTIHYRLGAIGFLSTGDSIIPGNNGLKDMREALRWVQDNIEDFNGDKDRVTIFGESAGGSAVLSLLLSHSTKGLFHQVIAQSGTPIAAWARDVNPKKSFENYAKSVNCNKTDTQEAIDCMKALPWETLAKASFNNILKDLQQLKLTFEASALVIEPDSPHAFMIEEPADILRKENYPAQIPIMLGATKHEGSAVLGAAYALNLGQDGKLDDPEFVQFELVETLLNTFGIDERKTGAPISQTISKYYFPDSVQRNNFTEITPGLVDMLSVFLFKAPILRTADYLSLHSDHVYLYSFDWEGFNSLWTLLFDILGVILGSDRVPVQHGVMHADDLQYFFTLPFIITGKDRKFSDMVCKIWTDFATSGNPTPGNQTWPKWNTFSTKVKEPHYYKLDMPPLSLADYTKSWQGGYENTTAN